MLDTLVQRQITKAVHTILYGNLNFSSRLLLTYLPTIVVKPDRIASAQPDNVTSNCDTHVTPYAHNMASKTLGIRFLYILSILCFCMIPSALGTSYNYGFNVTGELKAKRAPSDALVTTGMPLRSNGSVPVRYEIRDLQKDTDKWTLYILALDLMQYTDQSVVTSWFSIAGMFRNLILLLL